MRRFALPSALALMGSLSMVHAAPADAITTEAIKSSHPPKIPVGCRWDSKKWGTYGVNVRSVVDDARQTAGYACWVNGTDASQSDSTRFTARDADVVSCLIGLHAQQDDVCISTQGSACDVEGYTRDGGQVDNVAKLTREIHFGRNDVRIPGEHAAVGKRVVREVVRGTVVDDSNQFVVIMRDISKATGVYSEIHVNFVGGKGRC